MAAPVGFAVWMVLEVLGVPMGVEDTLNSEVPSQPRLLFVQWVTEWFTVTAEIVGDSPNQRSGYCGGCLVVVQKGGESVE